MAQDLGVPLRAVIGSSALLRRVDLDRYKSAEVGEFTLKDILAELDKPGRDPRKSFEPPKFRDDVRELGDLKIDMQLEGVVTNVAAFGAFVDVGVHQDGLVHISELSDRFVKDPHSVVKVGDKISVRVLSIDLERKRISLSAKRGAGEKTSAEGAARPGALPVPGKAGNGPGRGGPGNSGGRGGPNKGGGGKPNPTGRAQGFANNPFADLLKKA
jgi:uncharacterized protein